MKNVLNIAKNHTEDCSLFVFPEYAFTGVDMTEADLVLISLDLSDPEMPPEPVQEFLDFAAMERKVLIFNIVERSGPHFYNTVLVVDDTGQIVDKYRKKHLYWEARMTSGGETTRCVDVYIDYPGGFEIISVVPLVCFDTQFVPFDVIGSCNYPTVVTVSSWWPDFAPLISMPAWGGAVASAIEASKNTSAHDTFVVWANANAHNRMEDVTGSGAWAGLTPLRLTAGVLEHGAGMLAPLVGASVVDPQYVLPNRDLPATAKIKFLKSSSTTVISPSCRIRVGQVSGSMIAVEFVGDYNHLLNVSLCGVIEAHGHEGYVSNLVIEGRGWPNGTTYPIVYNAADRDCGPPPQFTMVEHGTGADIMVQDVTAGAVLWHRPTNGTEPPHW
ncbi:Carbon-nitrogen hydrolase [Carpediemonas membranifera]|uniref:Carbon-nitrogen hydrolase n=1 Tax=Carpediemonas membranifera TaxID=201153 RepID=A0A8J6AYA5_9EUKA|nr:Carbon-nitrogen hydrolase [Carpediemonas membranifera]|eukprot:KAG9395405.1 Carbon-nitrogen hydrolase [Carpediemonas membranifera]